MGFFERLFGKRKDPPPAPPEHAVIAHFEYGSTDLTRIFALEDQLERVIADADAGTYDGNEVAADGSDGSLYMYGPDGDRLFAVARPVLERAPFMKGARVVIRYGPPAGDVRETEVAGALTRATPFPHGLT